MRQAHELDNDAYERRVATDLVAMLPDDREQAKRVLAYVEAFLDLTEGETGIVSGSADA